MVRLCGIILVQETSCTLRIESPYNTRHMQQRSLPRPFSPTPRDASRVTAQLTAQLTHQYFVLSRQKNSLVALGNLTEPGHPMLAGRYILYCCYIQYRRDPSAVHQYFRILLNVLTT